MNKILVSLLLASLISLGGSLVAHEGNSLDPLGGHNCWVFCPEQGLYQGEYHRHK